MVNKGPHGRLGATDSGLRPGRFALGSAQSRAAARALIERRFAGRARCELVIRHIALDPSLAEPQLGEWYEGSDGQMWRCSHLPAGMTIEEAERIVAERGQPPLKPDW
jgi:hypothetical protein